ncbi:spore coat protein GerQ [Tannockella kyphosi]|uniref:spore coat protein GerQ n=1 Tax=Tannockella kyphosi TaxID=2899121 RepID=UPI0020123B86|nr:spore coat protein GerQ [Tannockella kyphosi]
MSYFDDLNPYLIREEQTDPLSNEESVVNPVEEYTENILKNNIGKLGTFYFTYTGSTEWRDRVYRGVLEQAGIDHFVIRDPQNNRRYLLASLYYVWAEFDEALNY